MGVNSSETSIPPPSKTLVLPLHLILPITSIGVFMGAMDGSIVNISLFTIAEALGTNMTGIREGF